VVTSDARAPPRSGGRRSGTLTGHIVFSASRPGIEPGPRPSQEHTRIRAPDPKAGSRLTSTTFPARRSSTPR